VAAINVFTAPNPGRIDVAEALGSAEMAMYVYDVDSGEGSSPYHYEYVEEWLLVVDGSVVVRTPEGEITLERGDLFCFPAGPAGAHKVMNRSDSPARTLLFSRAVPRCLRLPRQQQDRGLARGRTRRPDLQAGHRGRLGRR
jgi:uncharacterized cupin superfamily protein